MRDVQQNVQKVMHDLFCNLTKNEEAFQWH